MKVKNKAPDALNAYKVRDDRSDFEWILRVFEKISAKWLREKNNAQKMQRKDPLYKNSALLRVFLIQPQPVDVSD